MQEKIDRTLSTSSHGRNTNRQKNSVVLWKTLRTKLKKASLLVTTEITTSCSFPSVFSRGIFSGHVVTITPNRGNSLEDGLSPPPPILHRAAGLTLLKGDFLPSPLPIRRVCPVGATPRKLSWMTAALWALNQKPTPHSLALSPHSIPLLP